MRWTKRAGEEGEGEERERRKWGKGRGGRGRVLKDEEWEGEG